MSATRPRRARPQPTGCTSCGASDAIQIELSLPDGTDVIFSSCHRCEHRWWDSRGETIDLTTILDKSRKSA